MAKQLQTTMTPAEVIKMSLDNISSGVYSKDSRHILRALRSITSLRRNLSASVLSLFVTRVLADAPNQTLFLSLLSSSELADVSTVESADVCMEDAAVEMSDVPVGKDCKGMEDSKDAKDLKDTKGSKDKKDCKDTKDSKDVKDGKDIKENKEVRKKTVKEVVSSIYVSGYSNAIPEIETFLKLLTLIILIDRKLYDGAITAADAIIARLRCFNRRTLDLISAKAYFYYSLAYELKDRLADIRKELYRAHRTATVHHNPMGQAVCLNLLLRNYLHYNLHELAMKLITKTTFPENLRSNSQHVRYLYYVGCIEAVQLDYSEAHSHLSQAIRKAPQGPKAGKGFRLAASKMALVVELLMGDIPDRQVFNQKELKYALLPYKHIVLAVRSGDLSAFIQVVEKYKNQFEYDKTLFLIERLHRNVIRAGLRMINASYAQISLRDVARKLGLESQSDAEGVVSKAIKDGVMEAFIDHQTQAVQSQPSVDLYSSSEPMRAFHKRIAFCMQLHADAVKAMTYPEEKEDDKNKEAEERRREQQEQMARAEDDFDLDL